MAYVALVLQSLSHLDFISIIANSVGKNGTMAIATIQAYVSKSKWIIIQQGSACLAVVLGLLFLWFIIKFKFCTNIIYNLFKTIYYDVKKILHVTIADKYVFIICMVFLVTHSLYYILHWAIQYDECWTYNYFLTKNIAFSFLTPNNNHNLFIPIIACVMQKQILYERIFTYLVPFVVIGFSSLFALFLKQKNANQILGILFLASGAFFYTQHTLFNWNIGKDKAVQETAKLLLDKNIDSLYNYVDYTKPGLEYYYKQANKNLSIEIHNTNSIDYLSFDSTTNYESIIFENKTFNNTHLYKVEKIQNEWTVLLRE